MRKTFLKKAQVLLLSRVRVLFSQSVVNCVVRAQNHSNGKLSGFHSLDMENYSSPYGFTSMPFSELHPSHIRGRGCRDIRSRYCSWTPRLRQHHHLRVFRPPRKHILGNTMDLSTRPPARGKCMDCSFSYSCRRIYNGE